MDLSLQGKSIRIITSEANWIEGEAVRQLEKTAELPGMIMAVGLPELHPGKGIPIGAAFAAKGVFYPYLIGNDVGCGMGLWRTELKRRKIKRDRWVDRLSDLDSPWDGDVAPWLEQEGVSPGLSDPALGTIGGGNHFAELQMVERVDDPHAFENLSLSTDDLVLLVHSGSRGLGESLLRSHVDRHKAGGLNDDSEEASRYLAQHAHALGWARANRALIAHRFLSALRSAGERALDTCHNSIARGAASGAACWLHRKGVVPSDGPTVIAGSRGSMSYLVAPDGNQDLCLHSLTHGAGRKWKRGDSKARLRSRYKPEALTHTELGSRVICEDKDLLYEEAPQAYKDIETVVKVLLDAGLIRIIAVLRPVITYKTRRT
jgi:release factor H-coupled RctB family protein